MPLEPKIREIAAEFQPGRADFLTALAEFLTRKYRVHGARGGLAGAEPARAFAAARGGNRSAATRRVAAGRDLAAIQSERREPRRALRRVGEGGATVGARSGSPRGRSAICRSRSSWRKSAALPLLALSRPGTARRRGGRAPVPETRGSRRRLAGRQCAGSPNWCWRAIWPGSGRTSAGLAKHLRARRNRRHGFHRRAPADERETTGSRRNICHHRTCCRNPPTSTCSATPCNSPRSFR